MQVEPDRVTIVHQGGIATVSIETLSPEIRKLLNYDPIEAGRAAAKRVIDRVNRQVTQVQKPSTGG
jgi:hypothetical protein